MTSMVGSIEGKRAIVQGLGNGRFRSGIPILSNMGERWWGILKAW